MGTYIGLLIAAIRGLLNSRQDLVLENLALRHQLAMCGRRARVHGADRLLWVALFRRWTGWRSALVVLKPDTVVTGSGRGSGSAAQMEHEIPSTRRHVDRPPHGMWTARPMACGPPSPWRGTTP